MPAPELQARAPQRCDPPRSVTDPDVVAAYLEDASGAPAGRCAAVVRPRHRDEAAAFLAALSPADRVICQAARSSLTGGAIPRGETVLSVERMTAIGTPSAGAGSGRVRVDAGVRLDALEAALVPAGLYFPPVPTYRQAMIGGTCATNAAGAATFKYGVTRDWVHGLEVLLFNGDRLELERGQATASPGESFRVRLSDGQRLEIPAPSHRLPQLRKISAGYHAADPLDLVDLFVGSEGTLGWIAAVTLDLVALPPTVLAGAIYCPDATTALGLTAELRRAALAARGGGDDRGPDLRAIELLDRRSLRLVRQSAAAREHRLQIPEDAGAALLFELELPVRLDREQLEDELARWFDAPGAVDGPIPRVLALVEGAGALDGLELALPGDGREAALVALREGPPTLVAERLAARKREHPAVRKIAGDMIVPFAELGSMFEVYRRGFRDRGLDFAIWGHVSDGNLHANAIPANAAEVEAAIAALEAFAEEAARRGGAPLSEHGVGRDPLKQRLLRRFVGDEAIAGMRRTRAGADPVGRFAPGVLFPA